MSAPGKKQKRLDYRTARDQDGAKPGLPRKKFYRQRAHANPFSDHTLTYPASPAEMDWSPYFPDFVLPHPTPAPAAEPENTSEPEVLTTAIALPNKLAKNVEVVDIGCGFGGLLVALAPQFPDTLMLGLEIRTSVTEYVQERILALRQQHDEAKLYRNIGCLRANSMKFLPNFFTRGQLSKIFICFPDPHFKARKHKARIVSTTLNSEYAFSLRPGGIVYTITDVAALHEWMVEHFDAHPSFERVAQEDQDADDCVRIMSTETEEGKKVERNGGRKYVALYRRLPDPDW